MNENDRELLELAARAAGHEGFRQSRFYEDEFVIAAGEHAAVRWNPLKDDGDALRLAVKLTLLVDVGYAIVRVRGHNENEISEPAAGDPYAATRRAIVRAAAEIGRTK